MRIVEIRERTLPISRDADPAVPSGGLTANAVSLITDVIRGGRPVIGYLKPVIDVRSGRSR
jgi:hypothetical protein